MSFQLILREDCPALFSKAMLINLQTLLRVPSKCLNLFSYMYIIWHLYLNNCSCNWFDFQFYTKNFIDFIFAYEETQQSA